MTGTWAIMPPPGSEKKEGDTVENNDVVLLKNLWSEKGGGYLDTNGPGGDHLKVCTSHSQNRKDNSGLWRIITEFSMPEVQEHETVHLLNGWDDWQGGF